MRFIYSASFIASLVIAPFTASAADMDKTLIEKMIVENWGEAATSAKKQTIQKDFTCDGKQDVIVGRVNGDQYDVLVMTEDGGTLYSEKLNIPFTGATTQTGLCPLDKDAEPSLSVETWTKEEAEEVFGSEICTESIMVSAGECDPQYYFWSPKSTGSKLAPYRL